MIYDITQPLFECEVYPGDIKPIKHEDRRIDKGDLYNLTSLSMCAHNGTHIDAPYHFLNDGKTIDEIDLEKCAGPCYVETHNGNINRQDAIKIIENALNLNSEAYRRILIRGKATVTLEAAEEFAKAKISLIGNESQTVGPENAPMAVHKVLLKEEIVILEGIRLNNVKDGVYTLYCLPLNLTDSDGSPCRAILIDDK